MELGTRAHHATLPAMSRRPPTTVARALWKASSAATSLLLVVGATVYGVALGSTAPTVSPVIVDPAVAVVSRDASGQFVPAVATGFDPDGARRGRR